MKGALLGFLLPAGPAAQAGSHDARLLGMGVAVAALLVIVFVATTGGGRALRVLAQVGRTAHRTRSLTPEKIIGYKGPARVEETPDLISHRIVERSEQIRRALAAKPSETEVTMCAMGYSACADDLLFLSQIVDQRAPTSGPIRRFRMRRAVRRATGSLTHARKALPAHTRPGPLGADAQEGRS